MFVKKAVITAAAERQRRLPLQTVVDRDGTHRTVLSLLINEIRGAGIDDVCVVIAPGDDVLFRDAVPDSHGVQFATQAQPLGYGHALLCARHFVGDGAFLHLVGDHVYMSRNGSSAAARLVQTASAESCCISAVQAAREHLITAFGVVGGQPQGGREGLYRVDTVIEKPTPTIAEQKLIVPGLRSGMYLTFFGMHVLTPAVLEIIAGLIASQPSRRITLSDALAVLAKRDRYFALQVEAHRYDLGPAYGLLTAQLALALTGQDRDEVLSMLVGLLATQEAGTGEPRQA
jgi:UTP--glucose-1-phosphate uridylyltransferase